MFKFYEFSVFSMRIGIFVALLVVGISLTSVITFQDAFATDKTEREVFEECVSRGTPPDTCSRITGYDGPSRYDKPEISQQDRYNSCVSRGTEPLTCSRITGYVERGYNSFSNNYDYDKFPSTSPLLKSNIPKNDFSKLKSEIMKDLEQLKPEMMKDLEQLKSEGYNSDYKNTPPPLQKSPIVKPTITKVGQSPWWCFWCR